MLTCASCGHSNPSGARFCEACGKTVEDPAATAAAADAVEADFLLEQAKSARAPLLIVAVLSTLGAVIETVQADASIRNTVMMIDGALVASFWAIWFFAAKRPFAAASAGLALYLVVLGINAWADPSSIYKGIIIKIFIVVALVNAVRAGLKHRTFVREKGID